MDRKRRCRRLRYCGSEVNRVEDKRAVVGAELLIPVTGIAGPAEAVDGNSCDPEISTATRCDAFDGAEYLTDAIGGPCARFGDD